MLTNLKPLYQHVVDTAGLRFILKVDSGPGEMNIKLLAKF